MNDSFILYTSYYAIIEELTDEQLGQLTRAIFRYARDREVISLEPVVKMAFSFIKDNIDRNSDKYQKKCERNRENIRKRWAKVKKDTTEYECITSNTTEYEKKTRIPYDNEYDNVNDDDVSKLTDNNIKESSKEASMSTFAEQKPDAAQESGKKPLKKSKKKEVDFGAIKDYWNERHDETNSAMRRITLMTDNRKAAIRGRLAECKGDVSQIYKAIDKAMASSYLNSGLTWATYDWVMTKKYFSRVLEGNYDDTKPQQPAQQLSQEPTIGERYQQATQRRSQREVDQELTAKILGLVDLLERDPKSLCRKALEEYHRNGTMARLGIDWRPGSAK